MNEFSSNYKCVDEVLVRIANTSLNNYSIATHDFEGFIEYINSNFFRESIAIASPSLLQALEFETDKQHLCLPFEKTKSKIYISLIKYVLRSISRATPFGVFSKVGAVKISSDKYLKLIPEINRHVDIIMNNLVEEDSLSTPYTLNTAYFVFKSRVIFINITKSSSELTGETSTINIKLTPLLADVMEIAKESVTMLELLDKISTKYTNLEKSRLLSYFKNLIDKGVLFHSKFTSHPTLKYREYPREIKDLMYDYRMSEKEDGYRNFKKLKSAISDVYKVTDHITLQVGSSFEANGVGFPGWVADEVLETLGELYEFNRGIGSPSHIADFTNEFIENLGDREISVVQLLDADYGLGAPEGYTYPLAPHQNNSRSSFKDNYANLQQKYLAKLLQESLASKTLEIVLEDLPKILKVSYENLPNSFEVYTQLHSGSEIEYVILSPLGVMSPSGRASGRFAFFSPTIHSLYNSHSFFEKSEEYIYADIFCVSKNQLINSISARPAIEKYEVNFNIGPSENATPIPVCDVLVGAGNRGLYLKLEGLDKKIKCRAGNMVNPSLQPNLVRFIQEVSEDGFDKIYAWNWHNFSDLPFLPRIRYKRIILSLARWNFPDYLIGAAKNKTVWNSIFAKWLDSYIIPRHVYVGEGDNRLILDVNDPVHTEIIRQEVNRGAKYFEEAEFLFNNLDDQVKVTTEAVIAFRLKAKRKNIENKNV